ncbi:unnamed protein product [Gongylonema pulchrum]|uniref:Uncharacterized protein n=1 Tax=Gongylonema pulchrum TaxID=637853 RepID=A0A3P6P657_9BILA|nr:unnamed protein product [Gongylonema pulchrum]
MDGPRHLECSNDVDIWKKSEHSYRPIYVQKRKAKKKKWNLYLTVMWIRYKHRTTSNNNLTRNVLI